MNPDTNELVQVGSIERMRDLVKRGFRPVPQSLEKAASLALGKKKKVVISKTSGGKLSKWAARKRRRKAELEKMVANCNAYYGSI